MLDGKLYASGGFDGGGGMTEGEGLLTSVECFDPSTEQWSPVAPMNIAKFGHGVGVVDNKMYTVGGTGAHHPGLSDTRRCVECYDPSTGQWSAVADMSTTRCGCGVDVVDGKLYAVGGASDDGHIVSSVECFDISTGQWSTVAAMSTERCGVGVAALDGKLYAVGGIDGNDTILRSAESFDPVTGQWSSLAPMGTARCEHSVAVSDGKLYAVGGIEHRDLEPLSSVECFNPLTGQWSEVASISTECSVAAVVALACPE